MRGNETHFIIDWRIEIEEWSHLFIKLARLYIVFEPLANKEKCIFLKP